MDKCKELLISNYLSGMQPNLTEAAYIRCCPEIHWKRYDFVAGYNKFYFIMGGEGWIKIGSKEYYPKPGQLFLIPSSAVQSYATINSNGFEKYWCHFTSMCGETDFFDIVHFPHFIDVEDKGKLEYLFKELVLSNQMSDITSNIRTRIKLFEIIQFYIENIDIKDIGLSPSLSVRKLNDVINYMHNNINVDISLDKLADIAHFHPSYFVKFFYKQMGLTPIHYINRIKLEKARELLYNLDLTISDVAEAVGFSDISYFSKAFKSFMGFSPSKFRNMMVPSKKED